MANVIRVIGLVTLTLLSPGVVDHDTKVGDAYFNISRQGEEIVLQPLLVPYFKLNLLKGDGKQPETIVKCGVWRRDSQVDVEHGVIYTVVVIKCGGSEYGVAEVDFRYELEERK